MNYQYPCPHCEAVTVIAENADFDGACTSCGRSVFHFPDEKAPVTAPTVNGGTKSIAERSVTTAYLAKHGDNTRHTFGTFSGESVPIKDHIAMILPVDAVVQMMDEGPVLVQINPGCVEAQTAAARKVREEEKRKKHAELRRRIARQISEEEGFEEQLAHLDAQATVIYDQIDKKVNAILNAEGRNS